MSNMIIIVPLNELGELEYENDVEKSENIERFVFSQAEYSELDTAGCFYELNQTFGVVLEEYEEDDILNGDLLQAYDIVKKYNSKFRVLEKAIQLAIDCGTSVHCFF